jgi:hypothetical protein
MVQEVRRSQQAMAAALAPKPTPSPQPTSTPAPPPPPPPPTPTPVNTPARTTPSPSPSPLDVKPALDPAFDPTVQAAEDAIKRESFQEALNLFDKARGLSAEEYAKRNLGARRAEAVRLQGLKQSHADAIERARQAVQQGRALLQSGQYAAADLKFQQALRDDSANADAASALEASARYTKLRDAGRASFRNRQYEAAGQSLRDARDLDTRRFQADGLEATLKEIDARLTPVAPAANASPLLPAIRSGLVAYFEGDLQKAIAELTPVAAAPGNLDAKLLADVHAFLSFAYGSLSLLTSGDAQQQARDHAVAEYRQALAARPGYVPSERVVPPRVLEILKAVR